MSHTPRTLLAGTRRSLVIQEYVPGPIPDDLLSVSETAFFSRQAPSSFSRRILDGSCLFEPTCRLLEWRRPGP